jgi:DNA-binding XRE family transcriptional regulator
VVRNQKGGGILAETLQITLAAARVNAGLTQSDVAEKMHVGKQTIVNWEKGKVKPPFASLDFMARLYSIPIDNIRL